MPSALVHRLALNHGKVFKCFMYAYLPDWESRERELRRHARIDSVDFADCG
jgi:predicted metal-dependent hydrolase